MSVKDRVMSTLFVQRKQLCVDLNCENWFLDCLTKLYGLQEMGHADAGVYLIEDVRTALVAHASDGRPTKSDMLKKIKQKGAKGEED